MTKYYLIDTWSGDGYTESGIIGSVDDLGKAIEMAHDEFGDRYLSQFGQFTVDNQLYGGMSDHRFISYSEETGQKDSGAIHILPTDDSTVGILLEPHVNDAVALTGDQFTEQFRQILNNIDNDEDRENYLQEMLQVGNSDAHTDNGYFILYRL